MIDHSLIGRCLGAIMGALALSFAFGPRFIALSGRLFRSQSRKWTPDGHRKKDGTPTMGGLFMLGVVFLCVLAWSSCESRIAILLVTMALFGALGAWDDWCKITQSGGVYARTKFVLQCAAALVVSAFIFWFIRPEAIVSIPFCGPLSLGYAFVIWAMIVLIATSNAVNLTDGLDGLAAACLIPNFVLFLAIAGVQDASEVALFASMLIGALIGFLRFNAHPAQIFMGDAGSLALGAGLGCIALLLKQELLLLVSGGVFVCETMSVILQVLSMRLRKKRIFRMAPIHHHFELIGWPEGRIVHLFAVVSIVLCAIAMSIAFVR